MPPQARRQAVSSLLPRPFGLRCGRRASLAWPGTAPQRHLIPIKPLAKEVARFCRTTKVVDWGHSLVVRRAVVALIVVVASAILARVVDHAMARHELDPAVATRYRVLRRSVMSVIVAFGVLSALLVIPAVRAVAGGILASTAIVGIIVGLAAQSTLSNFVAGIMLAFAQPLRLGDTILSAEGAGVVEEIGLVHTRIRLDDGSRLVIPNAKLTSDTIRNASIGSRGRFAEISVQLPLATDLEQALDRLRAAVPEDRDPEVFVTALGERATVGIRVRTNGEPAEDVARELRLRAHGALRAGGALA